MFHLLHSHSKRESTIDKPWQSTMIDMGRYNSDRNEKRKEGHENEDVDSRFKMFDITSINNENSLDVHSSLYKTFFSKENQWVLQNSMKTEILKMSNNRYQITEQSPTHLQIIMRCILVRNQTETSVDRLNTRVLHYCVPFIYEQSVAYEKYRIDESKPTLSLLDPAIPVDRNYRQLQYNSF